MISEARFSIPISKSDPETEFHDLVGAVVEEASRDDVFFPSEMVDLSREEHLRRIRKLADRAAFESLCGAKIECSGKTSAVIKCFSCIKVDPLMQGNYCMGCFEKRHPSHRVQHNWRRIDANVPKMDPMLPSNWVEESKRIELERQLLQAKNLLSESEELRKRNTFPIRGRKLDSLKLEELAEKVRKVRKRLPKTFSRCQAATIIQANCRGLLRRKRFQRFVKENIVEVTDRQTQKSFYINKITMQSTWSKPKLLCRKPKAFLSERMAARKLQGIYRTKKAREGLRKLIILNFEIHEDPASGQKYFFNAASNTTFWEEEAPSFLRNAQLLSPRSRREAKLVQAKKDARLFRSHKEMTDEYAAKMIQGKYRLRRCRRKIRELLLRNIRKISCQDGSVYFFNIITKQTSWTKPKLLASFDDEELQEFDSSFDSLITDDVAARKIQGMFRHKKALDALFLIFQRSFEKHLDRDSGQFYIFSKKTGAVFWEAEAPRMLRGMKLLTPRSRVGNIAARSIQKTFRAFRSRSMLREKIKNLFAVARDGSGRLFFINLETMRAHYRKPLLLKCISAGGLDTFKGEAPIPSRRFQSEEEAAVAMQGMFRAFYNRSRFRNILLCFWERATDDDGNTFFFNVASKRSSWTPPAVLGDGSDIMTPRSRAQKLLARQRKDRGVFKFAGNMSKVDAATLIQRNFRAVKARAQFRQLMLQSVARAFDDEGNMFFVNLITNEASWEKPALLHDVSCSMINILK